MELIAQIFGFTFVGIIIICLAWIIIEYIFVSISKPGEQNRKLIDNMKKMDKKLK